MKQWTKNDRIKKFLKQIDAMYMYHDFKTRQVFRYFGYPSQPLCNGTSFENSMWVVVQGQVKNLKVQVLGPLEKPEILAVKELLVFSSCFSVPGFWFLVYGFRFLVFDFDTPHSHSGMELVIQYSRLFTSRHKSRSF